MSVAETATDLDVLIIGGGIAGLWTLDELVRRGYDAFLVERDALGAGQTIWSQGIIHGGLKYTLAGLMNPSAEAIREMPALWSRCLSGAAQPDLSSARIRSQVCYLWRTDSITSRLGMIGAKVGLRVKPVDVESARRPTALRDCPGDVARLDEQVIDPASVLGVLVERQMGRVARAEVTSAERSAACWDVTLACDVRLRPRVIVLAAGNGTPALRQMLRLAPGKTQTRPLRMAMLRGPAEVLTELNGHCVDGSRTRVTVTSVFDAQSRRVWQVGGDIAEVGPSMSEPLGFLCHARRELCGSIPGLAGVLQETSGTCEWSFYEAPRAEAATGSGRRPDDAVVLIEDTVITAWPTKLALAPRAAMKVADAVGEMNITPRGAVAERKLSLPVPVAAAPPWNTAARWWEDGALREASRVMSQ